MAQEKRVIMAEKRNAAEDIAKAIGLTDITREGASGFIHGLNEDGDKVVITWSNGHCVELIEPEDIDQKYKKWNVDDLPLPLTSDKKLKVIHGKEKLFSDIRKELSDADNIVNAGDAGREGELIQRWIIKFAMGNKNINISRLWVQSLTESAIREAYENGLLGSTEEEIRTLDNLYDSGRARAIMDKYVGYNYSRLLSLTQTDGITVNYGRCKSPLVHAIIERDREIENFVSVPFSYLRLWLEKDGTEFIAVLVDEKKKRLDFEEDRKNELRDIAENLPGEICIKSITKKEKLVSPPQPYDTLQLQKEMANKYGFDADKTLNIMEKLYDTYHILSYPRTEARYYATELKDELRDVLKKLLFGEFKPFAEASLERFIPDKYFNNKKIADHHAIAPVCEGNLEDAYSRLSEDEKRVYDAVIWNFLALHLPGYEYETTEALAEAAGHLFLIKGKKEIRLGYKEIYANDKKGDKKDEEDDGSDQTLPELFELCKVRIKEKDIKDSKTKPKSRYTTSSLLDFMKLNNIGTGATRDRLISELTQKKGYNAEAAVKKEGKYFVSTGLGRAMDSVIPDDLKNISFLKKMEEQIQDIADGKLDLESFVSQVDHEFHDNLRKMKESSTVKLAAPSYEKKILSGARCPVCGMDISIKDWGYSCTGWKKDGAGCNFSIGKKQYNKALSEESVKELINDGKTSAKIKGMKGKSGKAFDAALEIEIGEGGKARVKPVFERR